jgi:hypothetical protein
MTEERGGTYGCEENEGQGEANDRQEGGDAVRASRLRSEDGKTEEDREEKVAAAAV